jgi:xanthine dehydrogenase YagS FAD-binding subunit
VSDHCIATYPGDFAQALMALDARVEISESGRIRVIPFAELHRLPERTPHIETTLAPWDLILGFRIPASPLARRSVFVKIRDRESYEFALAAAAVALELDGPVVRQARVALGGLATVPWRAHEAEAHLQGRQLDRRVAMEAAEAAFAGAVPREHNGFKIALGKRAIVRGLETAASLET